MKYGALIKRTLAVVLSCALLVTCPTLNGKFLNSGYAMELDGESGDSGDLSGYSSDDIAFGDGDTDDSDGSDGDSGNDSSEPDEDPKDPDEGQGDTGDGSGDSGLIPGSTDTDGDLDGTTGSGGGASEEENGEPEELGEPEEEIIPEEELEPVLTFEFEENSEFIDVSPEDWNNSANTQLILLQGVSVNDEYGNPVYSVWVRDDGGFDIDAVWPNNVFEITYAASHPVTGEIFTATREVYRTLGVWAIAPMAAHTIYNLADLQSRLLTAQGGDTITLSGAIANFTISSDIELKAPNATANNPVIIYSPAGQRHFNIAANITVGFENVVLDGENNGGGIKITGAATKVTLKSAKIINCKWTTEGGGAIFYNASGGELTVSNCIIDNNTVVATFGNDASSGSGGGIYAHSSSSEIKLNLTDNTQITNNTAAWGGGVYSDYVNMDSGAVSHNIANDDSGGGGPTGGGVLGVNLEMYGGEISYNKVTGFNGANGGGVGLSSSLVLDGGKIIYNETNGSGGGVALCNNASRTMDIRSGSISNNIASAGGGISILYIAGGSNINISGGEINNNKANYINNVNGFGGGICVWGGASSGYMTISGGTISGNTAALNGGGIYTFSALTLNGGAITLNKTTDLNGMGGGIYAKDIRATLTLNGGTISKNTSAQGGGIYTTNATTNAILMGGTATVNCKIDGNIADGASRQDISGRGSGGGIYLADAGGKITLDNGSITNNKSINGTGGGVYMYISTSFDMKGGEISSNEARDGGGVHVYRGTITMNGGKISGNTATMNSGGGYGGGLYAEISKFTMYYGEISGNTATNGGGGACVVYSSTFTMEGGTIGNNTALYSGGGLYISDSGTFTMNAGKVSDNTAKSNGGGVYIVYNGTFTMNTGEISGNTATTNGGGIYTASPFIFNAGTITLNKTTATSGKGGGIYADGNSATLTLNGGTINKNESVIGGGIYTTNTTADAIKMGGTATVNCKIDDNTATAGNGGGIYLAGAGGKLTLSYGSITNNKTQDASNSGHGGGVYMASGTLFDMDGGKVSNNTATGNFGGGVYVGGKFTMNDGIVGGNKVIAGKITSYVKYGGGVYVADGGEFIMNDGEISANYTEAGGGGVHISNTGTFTMKDGEISGNDSSTGGGVYVYGKFTMNKGTISGNTAIGNGGGVYVANGGGKFIMDDGEISSNRTESSGGGVYVFYSSEFTMNGGEISYNEANDGGGVSMFGSLFIMKNGKITNNEARIGGGIIGGVINIVGSGPVYATVTIKGGEISNNEATGTYGGGVALSPGSTFTVEAGKISNNRAAVDGGGIWTDYTNLGNVTVGSGVIFSGNTAALDFRRASDDDVLYASRISGTSWSNDKLPADNRDQGYNNFDIAYTRVEVIFNKNHTDAAGTGWTEANPAKRAVNYGDYIGVKPADPTRSGYVLESWNTDAGGNGTTVTFGATPTATRVLQNRTLTLYAQWLTNTVTVTFDSQGGTAVDPATVNRGSKATAPTPPPTKDYYDFDGWYKEPGCITLWNFDDPVNNDIILYAKWNGKLYLEEVPNLDYGTKDIPLWKQLFGLYNTNDFVVKVVNTKSAIWELTLKQTTIFAKNDDTMDGKLVFTKNNQIQGSTLYDATKTICANATGVGPTVTLNWNSLTDGYEILLQTGPEDGMKSNIKYQTVLTWTLVDKGRVV